MQFTLIDRITEVKPGESLVAVKALSMAEEYLRDHFPRFPVMPGVMMLESLFQASRWLVWCTDDFQHPAIRLAEARNVKYTDFVEPGRVLEITTEIIKHEGDTTTIKAQGALDGSPAVSARLVVARVNYAELHPGADATVPYMRRRLRDVFQLLYRPTPARVSAS